MPDQLTAVDAGQTSAYQLMVCYLELLLAAQATALRLTVLKGLSLRHAATRLEISCMSVQRAQKKALGALRQRLAGGG